jgi:hypothetical protein
MVVRFRAGLRRGNDVQYRKYFAVRNVQFRYVYGGRGSGRELKSGNLEDLCVTRDQSKIQRFAAAVVYRGYGREVSAVRVPQHSVDWFDWIDRFIQFERRLR